MPDVGSGLDMLLRAIQTGSSSTVEEELAEVEAAMAVGMAGSDSVAAIWRQRRALVRLDASNAAVSAARHYQLRVACSAPKRFSEGDAGCIVIDQQTVMVSWCTRRYRCEVEDGSQMQCEGRSSIVCAWCGKEMIELGCGARSSFLEKR